MDVIVVLWLVSVVFALLVSTLFYCCCCDKYFPRCLRNRCCYYARRVLAVRQEPRAGQRCGVVAWQYMASGVFSAEHVVSPLIVCRKRVVYVSRFVQVVPEGEEQNSVSGIKRCSHGCCGNERWRMRSELQDR